MHVSGTVGSSYKENKRLISGQVFICLCLPPDRTWLGGARGVMVIVLGNGHSDTSSNPGRDWLHFT